MKPVNFARFAIAGLMLVAGTASIAGADDFKREGEGARRVELDRMELKPFDASAWTKLSDWTNGSAVTPEDTAGKVVVICTWADWYAPSKRALSQAVRLAESNSAEDLVVIAVHNPSGWENAKKPAQPAGGFLRVAHDANNEFHGAIKADQDPNFYIIDRAGQLRFADIDKGAVERAVALLLSEKAEDAGGINARLAKEAAARDAEARRTAALASGASMVELPELPFPPPGADAYKSAAWPTMPKLSDNEPAVDPNAPPQLIAFRIPDAGWVGPKPANDGRATLVYFWHPETRLSYSAMDMMARADMIKTQRSRDLVVAGIVTKLSDQYTDQNKVELDPKKLRERVDSFLASRNLKHSIYLDPSGALFGIAKRSQGDPIPAPWVAIVSSDGVLRWSGWMGLPSFQAALEQVLRVDPGVIARREVEAAYLRSQGR